MTLGSRRGRLWSTALVLLILGFVIAGCSGDDPPQAQAQRQTAAPAQQQEEAQPAAAQPDQQEQAQPEDTAEQQQSEPEQQSQPSEPSEPEQQDEASSEEPAQQEDEQSQEQQASAPAEQADDSGAAVRSLEGVPGIVDPSNSGWPREVEGSNGMIRIAAKPMRIITVSIGHDEITLALVSSERLIAVGAVSKDATYSNVADLVQDKQETTRDPEEIIALEPDIVVTSPFVPIEVVDALERVGITVVQTGLQHDLQAQINTILLMGYIYGEEARAAEFADELQARYDALLAVTSDKQPKPSILSTARYSDTIWVAGSNSTQGELIVAAGGVNAAESAGVDGNQTSSLEGLIAMAPEIIIIPQPLAFGAEDFRQSLLDNEVLAEVPAIRDGQVHIVDSKHYTTLSFWNLLGAESLARMLWPDDFPEPPEPSFSLPE